MINMDRSPDRLKKMKKQLDNMGLKFKRFLAIDGSKIEICNLKTGEVIKGDALKTFSKQKNEDKVDYIVSFEGFFVKYRTDISVLKRHLSYGEFGCAMSHLCVINDVIKNKFNKVLVFEDDIVFEPDFKENVSLALKNVPNDFDVLFLDIGMCGKLLEKNDMCAMYVADPERVLRSFEQIPSNRYVVKLLNDGNVYGTHAYCLSFKGASKIIQNTEHFTLPIDNHILSSAGLRDLKKYAARKKMLYISDDKSLIQEMGRDFGVSLNSIGISPQKKDEKK
ncbi:hypothetical protein FACS189472_02780 [Alphaproteobacteria bacterium]|nr:hypothetical protein FACS189472_02780 [Alphaproteobacteria bacterium]